MNACPFCHIPFDKSGKHFCTAVREPEKSVAEKVLNDIVCEECAMFFTSSAALTQHIKANHMQPEKSELERIIEVLAWAEDKGALHFKSPYFEMVFPVKEGSSPANATPSPVVDDNQRAEAEILERKNEVYKNPIDDPDYYASAQDHFFNHQAAPTRR